ncbi:superoxide dismutase family protein [Ideonella alba]|uniref:Superoxide dismutase [Cu-Zn] n=1 Tax=Ideonella alba TaxID=2824118 RepID=A0A940Y7I8_9BURK|nr:superoxide dismutase family protein [Ideonella alba]MBQ0930238.1 superoxide dismutase family protein [Ideonella alba]
MRAPLRLSAGVATLLLLGLGGCAMHGQHGHGGPAAVATLAPTAGNATAGQVMFHEMGGHLMAHARITGLKPNAEHGFHLHEKGDCSAPDGTSAGGHFNPTGQPHGPQGAAHHAGDMPALKADANGVADVHFHLDGPTIAAGPASIIGRSVIVHAMPDDYSTQPTGNSGARIACGVIAAR